ncbi:MAG: DUF4391 domain-containing protein [Desulfosporosinus sp.]
MNILDFDFFELLDSLTIARSRKHILRYYNTAELGSFPKCLKPISKFCDLTARSDVIGYNDILKELSRINLGIYAPFKYFLARRLIIYEDIYDTKVQGGSGSLKQSDRERSLQVLMRINLLKRLESSVEAFRLKAVYETILKGLMPLAVITDEPLETIIEKQKVRERLEKMCTMLESKIKKEKQFNRKVELNMELQKKIKELRELAENK